MKGPDLFAQSIAKLAPESADSQAAAVRRMGIADVVLNIGAPYGDAVIPLPEDGACGGVATITGALLA